MVVCTREAFVFHLYHLGGAGALATAEKEGWTCGGPSVLMSVSVPSIAV